MTSLECLWKPLREAQGPQSAAVVQGAQRVLARIQHAEAKISETSSALKLWCSKWYHRDIHESNNPNPISSKSLCRLN